MLNKTVYFFKITTLTLVSVTGNGLVKSQMQKMKN